MNEKDRVRDYLAEIPNYLSVFIFSIFFNLASPILLEISKSTKILVVNLGLIFTFFTIGAALGQLTSVFYNRKFKKIQVVIAGYILIIPLIILLPMTAVFAFNPLVTQIIFWLVYAIGGYILGVIWIQANQFVLTGKIKNKDRLLTIFLTFYPIGAFTAPFISSAIVGSGLSWMFIYYIVIFLISINIILYILIFGRKIENTLVQNEAKISLKEVFASKTNNLLFIIIAISIIFYCSSETIVATWAPTFFETARALPFQSASFTLNLFWLFIIIGRIVALILEGRIKSIKILITISILAIASMSVASFVYSKYLIFVFIALAGLGYSAMFPLLISIGSTLYEKGRGILATFLFLSSNIGVTSAPIIIKYSSKLSSSITLAFSFILMAFVTIMLLLILYLLKRKNNTLTDENNVTL